MTTLTDPDMKSKGTGFNRLYFATLYSWQGLRSSWASEAAIRQEVIALALLLPISLLVEVSAAERALLVLSLFLVFIVELLNTGIEAVVDRIGSEYHELSGKAKDIGSAAVLASLITTALVWFIILY